MGQPLQENQTIGNVIMVEVVVNANMVFKNLVVDVVKCVKLYRREFM